MVTKEDLQAKYAGLSNEVLLGILEHKADYTDLAIGTVTEEIKRRNLTAADHQAYEEQKSENVKISYENAVIDLIMWHKALFYIVFIPVVRKAFKANFYEDGSLLKLKQANYFTYTSWAAILVVVFASLAFGASDVVSLTIWVFGFVPAYLVNEYYYKPRQVAKINRQFGV